MAMILAVSSARILPYIPPSSAAAVASVVTICHHSDAKASEACSALADEADLKAWLKTEAEDLDLPRLPLTWVLSW